MSKTSVQRSAHGFFYGMHKFRRRFSSIKLLTSLISSRKHKEAKSSKGTFILKLPKSVISCLFATWKNSRLTLAPVRVAKFESESIDN
jgi:hypothetical protein